MDNTIIKKVLPHIGAYLIMMALSFLFFAPYFQGKSLSQDDNTRAYGMQAEMRKVHEATGEWPKWTNSMFAGMPTYQILQTGGGNLTRFIFRYGLYGQGIASPPFVVLLAMACCYLLLVTMKMDWRIALIGAIGYGLSTYMMDLAEAGHSTKMVSMAYVPGVLAGALLAFRGRYWLGGGLFALFLSLNIYANHLQITFYMFLILGILGLIKLIAAVKKGELPAFAKAVGIMALGLLLGIGSNLSRIWSTQEYAAETIRGKSELSSKLEAGKGDGLEKDYIFAWSYGKMESFTLLVPNFMGGGASHHFRGTKTHDRLYKNMEGQMLQNGMSRQEAKKAAEQQIAALFYWGDQPFVGTAIYFGVVLIFLFVLGAFLVKGDLKLWLLISAIFALMLAWGGNFFLNHFLVDFVPYFNKFRAVSMALGLSQLAVILLAMLGLSSLFSKEIKIEAKQKALYFAAGITGGLCLLALILGSGMDMSGARDAQIGELARMVKEDRASVLRADVFRSLLFILIATALIFAYLKGKLKAMVLVILLGLVSVIDVWMVNKRILFAEKYGEVVENKEMSTPDPLQVDLEIQKDNDPHYRVLDLTRGDPFKNANTSFFHKSIGGYHAAKLMRFQEVVDRYLNQPTQNMHLLGMLNTKYVMFGQGTEAQYSRVGEALGNAWFVDEYRIVDNADEEINALADLQPATEAVVQKKYAEPLAGLQLKPDSTASIELTSYHPDHLVYEYSSASEQLAVFSEVYYPPSKGWNTYLNGEKYEPFTKANYLLRALRLPPGQNQKLEMKFEPKSFVIGDKVSLFASLVLLLGFFAGLYLFFKNNGVPDPAHLADADIGTNEKGKKTKLTKTRSKGGTESGGVKKVIKKKPNKGKK